MISLEMKNYKTILIEKQSKYRPYHLTKLISIIEQAKFIYSPFGKSFEKQIKNN